MTFSERKLLNSLRENYRHTAGGNLIRIKTTRGSHIGRTIKGWRHIDGYIYVSCYSEPGKRRTLKNA